jgi:3-deoxy-D-manno-octulosonic-acid transferase
VARDLYGDRALFIGLFPFDFWPFSKLAWDRIFPHIAILVESEIWPEHVWQAHRRGVPIVIVNGRISDKTLGRYRLLKDLAEPILGRISQVFAADQISLRRCGTIGIPEDRIKLVGNLKFDGEAVAMGDGEKAALRGELGFGEKDLILLGSSTWQGEEEMLIGALRECRKTDGRWKLLLVPRHAERRDRVGALVRQSGLRWHRRSTGQANGPVDVCLADTTGELQRLTAISDLAFIGKSLLPNRGGQSPLDAACCGVPMVYGDQMGNFTDICASLERNKCVVKARTGGHAIASLASLAGNEAKRQTLAQNLKNWHSSNCGASKFVAERIGEIAFAKDGRGE